MVVTEYQVLSLEEKAKIPAVSTKSFSKPAMAYSVDDIDGCKGRDTGPQTVHSK